MKRIGTISLFPSIIPTAIDDYGLVGGVRSGSPKQWPQAGCGQQWHYRRANKAALYYARTHSLGASPIASSRSLRCYRLVGGSNPSSSTTQPGSVLDTWVTVYAGDMGNSFVRFCLLVMGLRSRSLAAALWRRAR